MGEKPEALMMDPLRRAGVKKRAEKGFVEGHGGRNVRFGILTESESRTISFSILG
jgi:hypothetical protein